MPSVVGMKQSSGDLKSLSDLVAAVKPRNLVLSGIDALLYPAFALGAHGAISALTTAVPGACVKLHRAVQAGDHATALDLHRRLGALWNATPPRLPQAPPAPDVRERPALAPPRPPQG